jgi:hypothetical protein
VSYRLRLKKQLIVWQIIAQADGSTLTENINVWVVCKIKETSDERGCGVLCGCYDIQSCDGLVFHSFIYSVFHRSNKMDIECVIVITVGTVKIESWH